jgi:hydroxymethylpyrimidine/phosphomethylpyrimidine kinase
VAEFFRRRPHPPLVLDPVMVSTSGALLLKPAALLKGGHLRGLKQAVDLFYDGRQELLLTAPFIRGVSTHGTGCTYSAAIAAHLARGCSLPRAVQRAKEYITRAIARSQTAAGHSVLNW